MYFISTLRISAKPQFLAQSREGRSLGQLVALIEVASVNSMSKGGYPSEAFRVPRQVLFWNICEVAIIYILGGECVREVESE